MLRTREDDAVDDAPTETEDINQPRGHAGSEEVVRLLESEDAENNHSSNTEAPQPRIFNGGREQKRTGDQEDPIELSSGSESETDSDSDSASDRETAAPARFDKPRDGEIDHQTDEPAQYVRPSHGDGDHEMDEPARFDDPDDGEIDHQTSEPARHDESGDVESDYEMEPARNDTPCDAETDHEPEPFNDPYNDVKYDEVLMVVSYAKYLSRDSDLFRDIQYRLASKKKLGDLLAAEARSPAIANMLFQHMDNQDWWNRQSRHFKFGTPLHLNGSKLAAQTTLMIAS